MQPPQHQEDTKGFKGSQMLVPGQQQQQREQQQQRWVLQDFFLQGPSIPELCNSHSFRNNFTALETYWCDAMMIGIETNNDRKKKKPLLSSKRNEDYKKKERERCYDNVRKAKVLMKRPKESYWREVETTLHRQRGSKAWVRKLGQDYQVFRKTQWTQFGQFCLHEDFFT